MELILKTDDITFKITKHNPKHPTIKNLLEFEVGDFSRDMSYLHDNKSHCISINNSFHDW